MPLLAIDKQIRPYYQISYWNDYIVSGGSYNTVFSELNVVMIYFSVFCDIVIDMYSYSVSFESSLLSGISSTFLLL